MINVSGFKVYPINLEALLLSYPKVIPGSELVKLLISFSKELRDHSSEIEKIKKMLNLNLPSYAIPTLFEVK